MNKFEIVILICFVLLVGWGIYAVATHKEVPPADFCGYFKSPYDIQCRTCEQKGGVYISGGAFGTDSCNFK